MADHGLVIEAQKQVQMVERAREALAELQERVAEKDAKNRELQRALEKAQEELRQSQGIIEKGQVRQAPRNGLDRKAQASYDHALATFRRGAELQALLAAHVEAGSNLKLLAGLRDLPPALMAPLRRVHGHDLAAILAAVKGA